MTNLIEKSKLIFVVLSVLTLLPVSSLMADEWEGYYDVPEPLVTDTDYYHGNNYWWDIICDANQEFDDSEDGFLFLGQLYAYTNADIWTFYSSYSGDSYAYGISQIEYTKDWEWTGAPGTSPGAYVDVTIVLIADHSAYSECWDSEEAYLYAEGETFTYGRHYVTSYDYDVIGGQCYGHGYIEDDEDPWFNYGSYTPEPDYDYVYLDDCGDTYYQVGFEWYLITDIDDYVVSSGLSSFSTNAYAGARSISYVELDYDGSAYYPEAVSNQEAYIEIYATSHVEEP